MLIPIRYLLNGATIAQIAVDEVTYWHIELMAHDVLLAEGLPAESYLDTGNRGAFDGRGAVQAHPNFARQVWAEQACGDLVTSGPRLAELRDHLLTRAKAIGWTVSDDPELRFLADGKDIAAARTGNVWRIELPSGTREVRLVTRAGVPSHVSANSSDCRRLGIPLRRLTVIDASRCAVVPLDHGALSQGWHPAERESGAEWRWTDGDAHIRATLWSGIVSGVLLEAEIDDWHRSWRAPDETGAVTGRRRFRFA